MDDGRHDPGSRVMLSAMGVVEELLRLGGVSSRAALIGLTSRAEVDRALRVGDVVVPVRGRYALPSADEAVARAHAIGGVLSYESAALWHGWAVKTVPDRPQITVPKKRKVPARLRAGVDLHRGDPLPEDFAGIATGVELTLSQCLRSLAPDAALAVADSALRAGVTPSTLRRVGAGARGPGSLQVRRIVETADGDAANPFESVLRSVAHQVPGLQVVPQLSVRSLGCRARPDLVDEHLGIVIEADSFEWHGDRAALRRDARRYDLLTAAGWIVLRFAWEDVMHDQDFVRRVLVAVVALVAERTQAATCRCRAA